MGGSRIPGSIGLKAKSGHNRKLSGVPGVAPHAGASQRVVEGNSWSGVPTADKLRGKTRGRGTLLGQIFFPTGKSTLDETDAARLKEMADLVGTLFKGRVVTFQFIGYADFRGDSAMNETLARMRALSVKAHFMNYFKTTYGSAYTATELAFEESSLGEWDSPQPLLSTDFEIRKLPKHIKTTLPDWRRVDVYVDGQQRTLKKMSQRLRKAARQALQRHEKAIDNFKKQIEIYGKRLKGRVNPSFYDNLIDRDHYRQRLEQYEKQYKELREAVDKGDSGLLGWWARSRLSNSELYELQKQRRKELIKYVQKLLKDKNNTEEEKKILKQAILFLEGDIKEFDELIKTDVPL